MFKRYRYLITAQYDQPEFRTLLDAIAHDTAPISCFLKEDTTTSVWCTEYLDRLMVIKRYNTKNRLHAIRRIFRRSRADNCWQMSQAYNRAEISTPETIAVIQEWWGPFKARSWFICKHVSGKTLIEHFSDSLSQGPDINQIASEIRLIFDNLGSNYLSHGDFKASNILLSDTGLYLIDLDSARKHKHKNRFKRAHYKDRDRFLENWSFNRDLHDLFKHSLE